jgi:hypothetical protein
MTTLRPVTEEELGRINAEMQRLPGRPGNDTQIFLMNDPKIYKHKDGQWFVEEWQVNPEFTGYTTIKDLPTGDQREAVKNAPAVIAAASELTKWIRKIEALGDNPVPDSIFEELHAMGRMELEMLCITAILGVYGATIQDE